MSRLVPEGNVIAHSAVRYMLQKKFRNLRVYIFAVTYISVKVRVCVMVMFCRIYMSYVWSSALSKSIIRI